MNLKVWLCASITGGALLMPNVVPAQTTTTTATAAPSEQVSVIDQVAQSIVNIEYRVPRGFDTYAAATGLSATGFVVDAERGIILTNRHVVLPGPVVARGVFHNGEDVPLTPLYRDPVHDFGFYKYDPKALEFTDAKALELYPEGARVGAEIRVVGNDNSRKLLVQDGEISRLDHNAPNISGHMTYQDWNTFYYVASTGSSGGSSGSPVVDNVGRAVALMSAANARSLTAFFLPLDRAARALALLQAEKAVPRGTLQTIFVHNPFNELRRIGLPREEEALARKAHPKRSGLLAVGQVLPMGPADGVLRSGDILVSVGGESIADFVALAKILDNQIGKAIDVEWIRDGKRANGQLTVQSLDEVSPSTFLEVGGDIVHELSYQIAREVGTPVGGVFVADSKYALRRGGIPRGAIITAIGRAPTPDLDAFQRVWSSIPDDTRVGFRYYLPHTPGTDKVHIVHVDRRWFAARRCNRDDGARVWDCVDVDGPARAAAVAPGAARQAPVAAAKTPMAFRQALVNVEFSTPYGIDGMLPVSHSGVGMVVDAKKGLVVVDRTVVNAALGDVELTFLGRTRISAEIVWLDPRHAFSVLRYDPARLRGLPVTELELVPRQLKSGDAVKIVGVVASGQLLSHDTRIKRMIPLELPLPHPPQFYGRDMDVITLIEPPGHIPGGVVLGADGAAVGLWGALGVFNRGNRAVAGSRLGIPSNVLHTVVAALRAGETPTSLDPGYELRRVTLRYVQDLGLPESWLVRLEAAGGPRPGALQIRRRAPGHDARTLFNDGDVLLSVNGETPAVFGAVDAALAGAQCARYELFRQGNVVSVDSCIDPQGDGATRRAVWWNGLALHDPHAAYFVRRSEVATGVYVSSQAQGSPIGVGLASTAIIAVNGTSTPNLDAFLLAVADLKAGELAVLQVRELNGKEGRHGLYNDVDYWPALEFVRTDEGWQRRALP
jgi:S1-C subfamily serine protease